MSSYVERVLDFLERHTVDPMIPKHLQEDIQWAIDIISANKLYAGSMQGFRLQEEKPEVKAWTDLINLKNIPQNKKETERLKQFEGQKEDEQQNLRKKILQKKTNSTLGQGDQRNSQRKGGKGG